MRLLVARRARMKASVMDGPETAAEAEAVLELCTAVFCVGLRRVAARSAEERIGWRDQWSFGLGEVEAGSAAETVRVRTRLTANKHRKHAWARAWDQFAIEGRARFERWI